MKDKEKDEYYFENEPIGDKFAFNVKIKSVYDNP